jgi:molecular chaperone HscA
MTTKGVEIEGAGTLFQIAEPTASTSKRRIPGRAIGIDLGTTHSLVAIAPNGSPPKVLGDGESLVPSVVSYASEVVSVGEVALEDRAVAPSRVLASIKRMMGRSVEDIDFSHPYTLDAASEQVVRIVVGGDSKTVSPVEVSAEILRHLAGRASAALGETPQGAVITVPAYFDDAQRQATKDAGRLAGLQVYRLLAEPTAAALAYGLDKGGQGCFAVYDLGGGTFDISVLRLRDGVFQVLATGGDSALGGDDFDRALARHLLEQGGLDSPTSAQISAAQALARTVKEALSDAESVHARDDALGVAVDVTRERLEELIRPLVRRSVRACRKALKDAGVVTSDLDGVVLVGGSTRVPLVAREVGAFFGRPPLADIDPDRVVAMGAAIQADILSGNPRGDVTLLDVVPLSLGLETMGGIVEKIVPRNATIPIAARQVFTNYSEQQTAMSIHVVQGERELADDCRSLARFELQGIPRLPPSMARVEVTFQLDADALLTVTARELMTQVKQTVEVVPTYGLSEVEIEQMVEESYDYAGDDYAARSTAEARVELGRVILAVEAAIEELTPQDGAQAAAPADPDVGSAKEALVGARSVMDTGGADAKMLNAARKTLESASEPLARRRMEAALLAGMSGKTLSQVESSMDEEQKLAPRRGAHEAETVGEGDQHA